MSLILGETSGGILPFAAKHGIFVGMFVILRTRESEHLEDKASAAEDEDEDEDEYEPTPAKPKARGGKSKGRQAPAKSAAVTGAKGKVRCCSRHF